MLFLVANPFPFVLELKAGSAWPRANGCKEWKTVNRDLLVILNRLSGNAIDRLERVGDVMSLYGAQMFGMHDIEAGLYGKIRSQFRRGYC